MGQRRVQARSSAIAAALFAVDDLWRRLGSFGLGYSLAARRISGFLADENFPRKRGSKIARLKLTCTSHTK